MSKSTKMRLAIFFVFLFGNLIGQNSILWEISGNGLKKNSYLYGTIHFASKKYFYVNPKVHEIKNKVDAGVFEIVLNQDSITYISLKMMAKPGEKIRDIYNDAEQKQVFAYFKRYFGFEELITNSFTPVALNTLMLEAFATKDTLGAIDQLLQNDFLKAGKPIYALESMRFQADLLTGMPIEIQKKSLIESINDLDSLSQSIQILDSAYMTQDLISISKLLNELDDEEYFNKELLNDARNLKMVKKLPSMMKDQSLLIAVGAAHLGGDKGLIALLEKKGFTLTAIK